MLDRLFPPRFDNDYRGLRVALWLFAPITVMKLAISLLHVFSADGGAQSISTIPLDSYAAGASQNIVALFARMGLEQLLIGALSLLALVRYRAMLPLFYGVYVVHDLLIEAIARFKPLALAGASGARAPALVLLVLGVAGFVLSLVGRGYRRASA